MRNRLSFFILSNSGSPVRQLSISKSFVRFLSLLIVAGIAFLGWGIYDYRLLKKNATDTLDLQSQISFQKEEIIRQRKQINQFAQDINGLRSEILGLNQFEKQIRIIANLENAGDQAGLFGVGGPPPEDLDTTIPLKEKHNGLMREMHLQTGQLKLASTHQKNQFKSLIDHLEDQVNLLASTPAIRPVDGWITCGFGNRKSPFTGKREFHKGIDIANRKGTPIYATADGVVTFAGNKGLLGKTIMINHGHGMVTRYGHSHKLLKKRGEKVKRGEKIALVGRTGRTTGSHVHYEVLLNGIPVNPRKYILN